MRKKNKRTKINKFALLKYFLEIFELRFDAAATNITTEHMTAHRLEFLDSDIDWAPAADTGSRAEQNNTIFSQCRTLPPTWISGVFCTLIFRI